MNLLILAKNYLKGCEFPGVYYSVFGRFGHFLVSLEPGPLFSHLDNPYAKVKMIHLRRFSIVSTASLR